MHPMMEQILSVLRHAEAFEEKTLGRFKLRVVKHGHDSADKEYFYSHVDAVGETFGCRTVVGDDEAWFEVFYEDNDTPSVRAYSLVLAYRPATRCYSLEIETTPQGVAEVEAVLGPGHEIKYAKLPVTADEYSLIADSMAMRYSQKQRHSVRSPAE